MTNRPPRPATPTSVTIARVLAVAQTVIGLLTSVSLGFLALLGLAWTTDDGTGPDALAIACTAVFAVALGVTIAVAILTGALRPGSDRVRTTLVVIEGVAVLTTLVLLATAGGSLEGLMVAPMLYAGLGIAIVVSLNLPASRQWSHAAPVSVTPC